MAPSSIFDPEYRFETRPAAKAFFSLGEEDPWDPRDKQTAQTAAASGALELTPSTKQSEVPPEWRRAEEGVVMAAPPLSLSLLHTLISQVCCEKHPEDEAARLSRTSPMPLPAFLHQFLRFRMTMKQGDASRRAAMIARSVAFHRRESHRVNLFSRIVGAHDPLPVEAEQIYTHLMAAMHSPGSQDSSTAIEVQGQGGDLHHFSSPQKLLPAIAACPVTKEVRAKMSKRAYRLHAEPDSSSPVYRMTDVDVAVDTMLSVWLEHHRAQEANREKRKGALSRANSRVASEGGSDGAIVDLLSYPVPPSAPPSRTNPSSADVPLPGVSGGGGSSKQKRMRRPVIPKALHDTSSLAVRGGPDGALGLWAQLRVVEAAGSEADGVLADLVAEASGEEAASLALGWQRLPADEEEMFELAATCLQKYLKRWVCRALFRVLRRAALTLQRHWRGRAGRGAADERRRDVAALLIERVARGHMARRRAQGIRADIRREEQEAHEAERREAAARVIQPVARGWLVRHTQTHSGGGSMTRICICNRPPFGQVLSCQVCMDFFHASCVGVSTSKALKKTRGEFWTCPDCSGQDRADEDPEEPQAAQGGPNSRRVVSIDVPRRPYNPGHKDRVPPAVVLHAIGTKERRTLERKVEELEPSMDAKPQKITRSLSIKEPKTQQAKLIDDLQQHAVGKGAGPKQRGRRPVRRNNSMRTRGAEAEQAYWMPAAVPDLIARFNEARPWTPLDMTQVRKQLRPPCSVVPKEQHPVRAEAAAAEEEDGHDDGTGPPDDPEASDNTCLDEARASRLDEEDGALEVSVPRSHGEETSLITRKTAADAADAAAATAFEPMGSTAAVLQDPLPPIQGVAREGASVRESIEPPDLGGETEPDLHGELQAPVDDADTFVTEAEEERSKGPADGASGLSVDHGPNPSAADNASVLAESERLLRKTWSMAPTSAPSPLLFPAKQTRHAGPLGALHPDAADGDDRNGSSSSNKVLMECASEGPDDDGVVLAAPKELAPLGRALPAAPPHEDLLLASQRNQRAEPLPMLKPLPVLGVSSAATEAAPGSPSPEQVIQPPGLGSSGSRSSLPPLLPALDPLRVSNRKKSNLSELPPMPGSFSAGNSSSFKEMSGSIVLWNSRAPAAVDVQQSVISSLTGPWLLSPPASAAEPPRAEASVKTKQGTEGEVTEAEGEEGASDHAVLKLPAISGQHGGSRADNPFDCIEEEPEALEMEGLISSSSRGEAKAAAAGDIRMSHQSVKSEVTRISSAYADEDWESFDDGSRRSRAAEEGIGRAPKSAKLGGHRTENVYSHAVDESLDNGIDTSRRNDDEAMEEEDIGMVRESPRSTSLLYTTDDAPTAAEQKLDDGRVDTSRDAVLAVEGLAAVSHHSLESESAKDALASSGSAWETPGDLNERRRARRARSRKETEQIDDEDITGAKSARSQETSSHAVDKSLGSSRDEEDDIPDVLQSRQSAISDAHKAPLSASGYGDDDDWEDMEEDDDHGKAVMEELAQASAPSWRSESHLQQLNEGPSGSVPGTDTGYDDIFGDGQGGDGLWLPDEANAGNSPMLPLAKAPLTALPPMTHLPKRPLGSLPSVDLFTG